MKAEIIDKALGGRKAAGSWMTRSPLVRQHFSVSRSAEYFQAAELQAQTGQPVDEFAHVALKELIDNALDAAETAGVAPLIQIEFEETEDEIVLTVADNGLGIPANVVERILDFTTRTSDKAAYRAPTRGQQGNPVGRSPTDGSGRQRWRRRNAACHRAQNTPRKRSPRRPTCRATVQRIPLVFLPGI